MTKARPLSSFKGETIVPLASTSRAKTVRGALLRWYRQHARPLPWRKTRDPYAIWVSEVMLQQTQVATVIPYYRRFLEIFPTARELARAPLERVLKVWSGMGYYRRARHLHQAARALIRAYGGHFPQNYEQARSLAGVGDYTARAVLSIAFNRPYAVLDGNVARVIARLLALKGNLHEPTFRRAVESELEALLSRHSPGAFNQSLMELGQTTCSPRAPHCEACPLRKWCRAFRLGNPEFFPEPRPRHAPESHHLAAALIRRGSSVALIRGLDDGLLGDLWNFPSALGTSHQESLDRLRIKLCALTGGPVTIGNSIAVLNHGITFRSIRVQIHPARITNKPHSFRWVGLAHLQKAAVSQLARKIASQLPRAETSLRNNEVWIVR